MKLSNATSLGLCAVALLGAVGVLPPRPAAAADQPNVMKLSLATINDSQHEFCKQFAAAVEKDSGGRIKGEIYPASQLGAIPRQIEGVQFGAIQAYIGPPEFMTGLDERFEVLSAPGLVKNLEQGVRIAEDPAVQRMMLALGTNKGLHGIALFIAQPSAFIARDALRHLADFKGKKLRVLAAEMQQETLKRLGATPVAMTLGDVLPAIQQGAIDGALAAMTVYTTMHYFDAAKYITESPGLPFIFSLAVMSKRWYDALPADLRKIVDEDAAKAAKAVDPWEVDFYNKQRKVWTDSKGEIIALPEAEQATMIKSLSTVGSDLAKKHPELKADFDIFAAAAKRTAQP